MVSQREINDFIYTLYGDVSVGMLSIHSRKRHAVYEDNSFIYGDSHLPSLGDIIAEVDPRRGEVFYDLGSGGGRAVLYSALTFPFAKCVGVELLDDLVDVAKDKLQELHKYIVMLRGYSIQNLSKIEFRHEDIAKTKLKNADVIYVASTCFDRNLMSALAANISRQVASGTRIITCTKALASRDFRMVKSKLFDMEWGKVTVFFQEKI